MQVQQQSLNKQIKEEERNYILLENAIDNSNIQGFQTIQDIVQLAMQRMKMIKEIIQEEPRCNLIDPLSKPNYNRIRIANKFITVAIPKSEPDYELKNKQQYAREILSHFLCKMAYAFYAEPEMWLEFARAEAFILMDKLKSGQHHANFFSDENLKIKTISDELFKQALPKIEATFSSIKIKRNDSEEELIKIKKENFKMFKFTDHPSMLLNNDVVLHKGYIIIYKESTSKIVQNIFIERLLDEMRLLQLKFQNNGSKLDDDRLSFLKDLHKAEIFNDSTQFNSTQIHHYELDKLAKRDMPACMTYLMYGLNQKLHLKHFGRLQLGLFLKGAGLSLNEALTFWQKKFSKTSADDFKKKYDYNIRHNYGRLGKQLDYTPMSCQKIIGYQPLKDEFHGCPYKTMESSQLKDFLKLSYNMTDEQFVQVNIFKNQKQYQLACKEVFKVLNDSRDKTKEQFQPYFDKVGNHPNAYFEQSLRLHEPQRFQKQDEEKKQNKLNRNQNFSANKQSTNKNNQMDLEF
ncbi:hypothetical protein ABPG74_020344 [Tetrahymena malaccensis]